jgi:hypothetical protein
LKGFSSIMAYDPGDFNLTSGNNPTNENGYLTFDEITSRINAKLDAGVSNGEISPQFSQWVKLNVEYFDPRTNVNKASEIRNSWDRNILSGVKKLSEMLEIFCGLAYVKALTSSSSGLRCSSEERNRVYEILGTRSPSVNNFRVWFPDAKNYPIIDSQVGYFEGNNLVAVFPISTKNVSSGKPNVIKFSDIFENAKQPIEWKKNLPRKSSLKQGTQTVVAAQGVRKNQRLLYPLYAAKSILDSKITTQQDKNYFVNNMRQLGLPSSINMQSLKSLLSKFSNNPKKDDKLDSILRNHQNDLRTAKRIILVLLRNSKNYKNPLSRISDDNVISFTDETWNIGNLDYPFTFGNLSLFFESTLAKNSVERGGETNYKKMVDANYFGNNRSLAQKYTDYVPLGAAQPVLAKVRINNSSGLIALTYDSTSKSNSQYGLRSKNAMNRLTDTLGIAP